MFILFPLTGGALSVACGDDPASEVGVVDAGVDPDARVPIDDASAPVDGSADGATPTPSTGVGVVTAVGECTPRCHGDLPMRARIVSIY